MQKITLTLSQTLLKRNNTTDITDEKLIQGILNDSNETLEWIYKKYYTKIKRMVWSLKNTVLIPEDIFQEGLTRVVVNIKNRKFRGDSSFYTYLNSICRNIALKELSRFRSTELGKEVELEEDFDNYEILSEVQNLMNRIDKQCKDIIEFRFNLKENKNDNIQNDSNKSLPFEEVAQKMNLTAANARQKFKRCLAKLREMVLSNAELKDYYN